MRTSGKPRIVIVGGGFAGVTLAQHLRRRGGSAVEVVLVSRANHMVFTPMLSEVVGRMVAPEHIAVPGRRLLGPETWLTADVTNVDPEHQTVHYVTAQGAAGSVTYDHLVLACGAAVDLDHVPGMAVYGYPLKWLGDAFLLTNDLFARLEAAAATTDPGERARLLTIVVVGGGSSGIEVAGAISDLVQATLRYYPQFGARRPKIIVLHRGRAVLPEFNAPSLSAFALAKLRARGVDVRLRTEARDITGSGVYLASGELIEAATVVCTVGTTTTPLVRALGLPLERGRLVTEPDMRVRGTGSIWALGDCALVPNAYDGRACPPTAQFATRQAKTLAANLLAAVRGKPGRPFRFRPLGELAPLGHRNAVAEMLGIRLAGAPAWLAWRAVYLGKLPGIRRKVQVAVDWAWRALFPPSIVELSTARTGGVGRAHYAAGEFVFRKGDAATRFFVIEDGKAGIYLDEERPPLAVLGKGDCFGDAALLEHEGWRPVSARAEASLSVAWLGEEDLRRLRPVLAALQRGTGLFSSTLGTLPDLIPDLGRAPVSAAMARPPRTLPRALRLNEALSRLSAGHPGCPVVDDRGVLVGYCGPEELARGLAARRTGDAPVGDIMRQDAAALPQDRSVAEATVLLRRGGDALAVTAADGSGTVVGTLTRLDVLRWAVARIGQGKPRQDAAAQHGAAAGARTHSALPEPLPEHAQPPPTQP